MRAAPALAERDKKEPFWARASRAKKSEPASLVVPKRDAEDGEAVPSTPSPEALREPSFTISHEASRRAALVELMTDAAPDAEGRIAPSLGPSRPEPAAAPDAHGWIRLSRAQAERHRFYGVRGWLVLLAVFVAVGLAMAVVELTDFWGTTDHGGISAWIMAVLRSVMALWAALTLGMLIGGSRAFPPSFVAYSMFNIIYLGLFGLAFAHVTHNAVFAGVAVAIPLNLIAIAYVLRSRRVNVTYRRRVRAKKEPKAPPEAGAEPSPA